MKKVTTGKDSTKQKSHRTHLWKRPHTKKGVRCEPQRITPRRNYTKKMTKREPQTRPGRVCGLHTKDRTNENGKRKSEKHNSLCEAEHWKTKKKKQTQKHDQQKRKRRREIGTLRADAGKKVRNTVEPK